MDLGKVPQGWWSPALSLEQSIHCHSESCNHPIPQGRYAQGRRGPQTGWREGGPGTANNFQAPSPISARRQIHTGCRNGKLRTKPSCNNKSASPSCNGMAHESKGTEACHIQKGKVILFLDFFIVFLFRTVFNFFFSDPIPDPVWSDPDFVNTI